MSLLDDLKQFAPVVIFDTETDAALRRVEAALRLLDHPGARQWLEALPGLIELGRKATPGPCSVSADEDGDPVIYVPNKSVPDAVDVLFVGDWATEEDATLVAAIRNALSAAVCSHEWEPCEDRSTDHPRIGRGCRKCDAFEELPGGEK